MSSPFKIYRYVDRDEFVVEEVPQSLNYKTGLNKRLHPIHEFSRGRIVRTTYYDSFKIGVNGFVTGIDPIVEEISSWLDNPNGTIERTKEIRWFREDKTRSDPKVLIKPYDVIESRTEGRRRRRNVGDQLSMNVVGLVMQTERLDKISDAVALCTPWLLKNKNAQDLFVELGAPALVQAISADSKTEWLNNEIAPGVSIRMYLVSELS